MSKTVTTLTLKDGTERVYESYSVEDYDSLRAQLSAAEARLVKAREWMQHDRDKCLAREWRNINCTCGLQAFLEKAK